LNVHFVLWSHASLPESFPNSPLGGAEKAMFEIAKRLTDTFRVHLHCWGTTSREVEDVRVLRYQIKGIAASKYIVSDIFYYKIMRIIRRMGKNQIVHTMNCIEPFFHSDTSFTNLLHLEGDIADFLPFPAIKKMLYLSRLGRVKHVIAVSNYIKDVFQRSFGYPEDRIVVLLNGADTELFTPAKRDRKFLGEKFGILEDDFVFLFSGRMIRRKGLHLAIEAFLEIAEANDHVWLLVAGASPKYFGQGAKTEQSIRITDRIASELRVSHPRILYLGPVNMKVLPLYYASSDVLIVPSTWEDPCPLTCAEAQASGIPVLGTARGGIPDSVIHGQTGLVCQPDVNEIRRNMVQLIVDKYLVKSLSKNARKRAVERLNWDLVADSIRKLYESLVTETQ